MDYDIGNFDEENSREIEQNLMFDEQSLATSSYYIDTRMNSALEPECSYLT